MHSHSECPVHRASCNFLSKSGHIEVVCITKKAEGKLKQKPTASSVELLHTEGLSPNVNSIEVLVDGCVLPFKVDCGAEASVVPSVFPGTPVKLEDPEGKLKAPSNTSNNVLPVLETYTATLSWCGKSVKQQLYVLAAHTVPLLGFPAIQVLRVCKFLDSVSEARNCISQLCLEPGIFQGLGTLCDAYTIRLKPDAMPFSLSVPRYLQLPLGDAVKVELDKLEKNDMICTSTRPRTAAPDWL